MKIIRTLLAGAMGLGMLAAVEQSAHAQAGDDFTADIGDSLTISMPTQLNTAWAIGVGNDRTESTMRVRVSANRTYTVQVACDTDANKGANNNRLFEYAAGAYVSGGRFLAAALDVNLNGGANVTLDGAGNPLSFQNVKGVAATGSTPVTYTVNLVQDTTLDDVSFASIGSASVYRMALTFTVVAGSVG